MSIRISLQLRLSYYPAIICGFIQSVQANIAIVPQDRKKKTISQNLAPHYLISFRMHQDRGWKYVLNHLKSETKLHYI